MRTGHSRWRAAAGRAAHLWKAVIRQHHRVLMPILGRCIPPDAIVFDVGAHAGQFSKMFAGFALRGRVYAIEPAGYALSILRAVVWIRRLRNVTIVPLALGAEIGQVRLSTPIKASGSHGFGLTHVGEPEQRWRHVATELVGQTTIDRLAADLALDRLDFIKSDIEGSEVRMLLGASATIARFRPRILIELNDAHLARAGDTAAGAVALLAGWGYRGFLLRPDGLFSPAAGTEDGDYWFFPDGDPLVAALSETGAGGPAHDKVGSATAGA